MTIDPIHMMSTDIKLARKWLNANVNRCPKEAYVSSSVLIYLETWPDIRLDFHSP